MRPVLTSFCPPSGLTVPFIIGAVCLLLGGWLSYYGASPSHYGLFWVFVGVLFSSAGATFLCTLPVPLSARWFPLDERAFATAVGAMALVAGLACSYVLQAALRTDIPRFLLVNALLATSTVPLAPLFRDPPNRRWLSGSLQAALLDGDGKAIVTPRTAAWVMGNAVKAVGAFGPGVADSLRLNKLLWLSDWRVALLLLGSTYLLGLGFTFLTLIDEVLPADLRELKTSLAVVFLLSGICGMVAIGSFVDATKEYIGTLRAVLLILLAAYLALAFAWQFSMQALLFAATSLVAASTFAVMPIALEIAVELTVCGYFQPLICFLV